MFYSNRLNTWSREESIGQRNNNSYHFSSTCWFNFRATEGKVGSFYSCTLRVTDRGGRKREGGGDFRREISPDSRYTDVWRRATAAARPGRAHYARRILSYSICQKGSQSRRCLFPRFFLNRARYTFLYFSLSLPTHYSTTAATAFCTLQLSSIPHSLAFSRRRRSTQAITRLTLGTWILNNKGKKQTQNKRLNTPGLKY